MDDLHSFPTGYSENILYSGTGYRYGGTQHPNHDKVNKFKIKDSWIKYFHKSVVYCTFCETSPLVENAELINQHKTHK